MKQRIALSINIDGGSIPSLSALTYTVRYMDMSSEMTCTIWKRQSNEISIELAKSKTYAVYSTRQNKKEQQGRTYEMLTSMRL